MQRLPDTNKAKTMLLALQHKNLFVISLDDEGKWFRYHNLFADLLLAKLQSSASKEKITELHQRAAKWYEQAGMVPEAIEHALCGARLCAYCGTCGT